MAQKLPPPPPPPLPEAANYLPPSPTQPESPIDTFDHSERHSFYKDNSDNLSNGIHYRITVIFVYKQIHSFLNLD